MPDKKPPGVLDEWQRTSETKSVVFHHLCVTGPDRASFWATFGVIAVPAIHFLVRTFVFSLPQTSHTLSNSLICKLSRTTCDRLPNLIVLEGAAWWALLACFVYLVATNLATLFKVALTDPGIVPRQQPPPGANDFSWPPAFKDVVIDGRTVQLKFCDTCYLYRPPRTIHCSVCNNCVSGLCERTHSAVSFLLFIHLTWLFSQTLTTTARGLATASVFVAPLIVTH